MIGRLRIGLVECTAEYACKRCLGKAEAARWRAAARQRKPAGYSWRLWHDPQAGTPVERPTGQSVALLPFWVREALRSHEAWKRDIPPAELQEAARLARIDAWLAGKDPWAVTSDRTGRRRRARQ